MAVTKCTLAACLLAFGSAVLGSRVHAETSAAGSPPAASSADSAPDGLELTFEEFLNQVADSNLDYAAQRYNVSIAEAAVAAAKAFQNPTLELNGARGVSPAGHERLPDTASVSLTQTFELGGKRTYRIQGARQTYAATAATLDDFLRNLRLDAAAAFADALALEQSAEHKRQSAEYLNSLATTQRERLHAGDISKADMLQTRVEAQQFQNELIGAEADAEKASLALNGFLGRDRSQVRLIPKDNLDLPTRDLELSKLLAEALENRPDLVALRHARDAAQSKTREEKANRIPNVDVGAGWIHTSNSDNTIAPAPQSDAVGVSFSVPLPLWNRNAAAIASARFTAEQAQKQLEAAELKAEVQIRQALSAYRSAGQRVRHYQSGILKDADTVLATRRFSYQRGQTTLLELLDAQRTANEVRFSYTEALAENAKALIELERAAGLWEIQL